MPLRVLKVYVYKGPYKFKFRSKKYESFKPIADPQAGEGRQGGTNGARTPSGDNNHTPFIAGPNLGVNVIGERLSPKDPNGGERREGKDEFKIDGPNNGDDSTKKREVIRLHWKKVWLEVEN